MYIVAMLPKALYAPGHEAPIITSNVTYSRFVNAVCIIPTTTQNRVGVIDCAELLVIERHPVVCGRVLLCE